MLAGKRSLECCLFVLLQALTVFAQTPVQPTRGTQQTATPANSLPANLFQTNKSSVVSGRIEPSIRLDLFHGPATDFIPGSDASHFRSLDVGGFIDQSLKTEGVVAHKRTTVANDVRIRGSRAGQNIGAGSLWNPGRQDLDTALNKIFANNIDHLKVVKGPYSVRYGPGFNFVDMQFLRAPVGQEAGWGGTTSLDYETNGEVFYGRQHVWGGDADWGVRVNYGHGTGNDYLDGSDFQIPASFKSRDLFVSVGHRLDEDRHIEFSYIRLDQTDVEFPGLVFDIDYLATDGFELEYESVNSPFADRFFSEYWYNRTRFEGSTLREAKNRQIPQLRTTFFSIDGVSGFALTDVDGSSTGGRWSWTWELTDSEVTVGTDFSYIDQTLNDIEPELPATDNNFPIPHSNAWDLGFFADYSERITADWVVRAGARADVMQSRSSEFTEGVPVPASFLKDAPLDQNFTMWSAYLTSRKNLDSNWWLDLGAGFSQRPPTLTELYADQSFIGTLQQGLTFVDGDPLLEPEKLKQIDVGLGWNYTNVRGSLTGFYSWIEDYITYDLTTPADPEFGLVNGVVFVNTDLATLSGFEFTNEVDITRRLTAFGKLGFVEGRDHTREKGARQLGGLLRSNQFGQNEPLPGISPMEAILGLHLSGEDNLWGVDFNARVVSNQDRIATSLGEIETPGFTTYDVRSFWQLTDSVVLFVGVENLTDKFYREHLDYRSGLGVTRRGVNGYFGMDFHF